MEPEKKRKQPGCDLIEDPISGDWREQMEPSARDANTSCLFDIIKASLPEELVELIDEARREANLVEETIYQEANSERQYFMMINDYLEEMIHTQIYPEAAPVALSSQMRHSDNTEMLSPKITGLVPFFTQQLDNTIRQMPLLAELYPQQQLQQPQQLGLDKNQMDTSLDKESLEVFEALEDIPNKKPRWK